MMTPRTLTIALSTFLIQACVIEVDNTDPQPPRRHIHKVEQGRLGDACVAEHRCAAGLTCFSGRCAPERVGIYAHGALVAPGGADGREWDSSHYVPRDVWVELDRARQRGVDALFDFMWSYAQDARSAPDVFGYGFLAVDGRYDDELTIALATPEERHSDSFEVIWPGLRGWTDVPLHEGLFVSFELLDYDREGDETIGLVEIDAWDIHDALGRGGVVWFDTYDATDGQLLLLGIEVISESW